VVKPLQHLMQAEGSQTTVSELTLRYVARRNLAPRDGGIVLMINMDSRVDNECPLNQNGDVDWPLRHMANEDNSEQHKYKQKGDGGPA
jgi:hypothetical protein